MISWKLDWILFWVSNWPCEYNFEFQSFIMFFIICLSYLPVLHSLKFHLKHRRFFNWLSMSKPCKFQFSIMVRKGFFFSLTCDLCLHIVHLKIMFRCSSALSGILGWFVEWIDSEFFGFIASCGGIDCGVQPNMFVIYLAKHDVMTWCENRILLFIEIPTCAWIVYYRIMEVTITTQIW